MKLELDLELSFLREVVYDNEGYEVDEKTYSLNETIEKQIIDTITNKIYDALKNKYEAKISEIVLAKIKEQTEEIYTKFLNTFIIRTNKWGEKIGEGTIIDFVKERFSVWMGETVDKNGKNSNSSYEKTYSRIEYIIEKQLKKHSEEFMQKTINEVSEKLEEKLSTDFRELIGQKIATKIGLDKLLDKNAKKLLKG